ncbi:MAG: glycoside hydrolase family 9 protein, partial [Cyanobacteria bacterium P01_E01_bin.43]
MNTRLLSWLYKLLIAGTTIAVLMLHAWIESMDATTASQGIVLNQVGYLPSAAKVALIRNAEAPAEAVAQLINTADDSVALTLEPAALAIDSASGDGLQRLDFSEVRRSGSYRWQYGDLESVPFTIATNPYTEATRLLLRSYYLQRCGIELADPETGIYHPPCHLHDGRMAHSDAINDAEVHLAAAGGWHDAGDYGKYVSTAAVTVGRLLSVYEQAPERFWDGQLKIPESGNGMPDLLDEMQVGLDWMLRMQRADGAVYRKLSGTSWPIDLTPDEDTQTRYVYGISTPETAKFAGAMAQASRIFQPFDEAIAQQYLAAAVKAWDFLATQPRMLVDEHPSDNDGSGAYLFSDWDQEDTLRVDVDDRLWAAAELFLTTRQEPYAAYFSQHVDTLPYGLFEWKDPSALGLLDFVMQAPNDANATALKERIVEKLLTRADRLIAIAHSNGYHLANDRFIWGSNKMVAEEGITLAYAYQFTGDRRYLEAAQQQLDYLLGRNPFNQTFITAVGTHPVQHVNHLFARARNLLIPGLVVGGP